MKLIPFLLLGLILPGCGWARIGDTIDELRKRYGTADRLHDEIGGLTVVEYEKPPFSLKFKLLELKTEGIEAVGDMSRTEAEVLIARNVPLESFTPVELEDGLLKQTFFVFFSKYLFNSGTKAYFLKGKLEGSKTAKVLIDTPKMQQYDKWLKGLNEKKELDNANIKIDSLEKPESTSEKSRASGTTPSVISDEDDDMACPPDIFRDRNAVSGGAQMGQDATFASMGTAIGRYKHKLYLGIGSRWNLKVQQSIHQIGVNRVVIKFFVNPDGSISQLDVVQGDAKTILGQISADAINQSSNLIGPFPDVLSSRYPKGFPWQLAFRIY
jgi:hypothetical protein